MSKVDDAAYDEDDYEVTTLLFAESMFGQQLGERRVRTHSRNKCLNTGIPCCLHNPSNHKMREFPLNWRSDTGVMERMCPHGVGHPDPDHLAYVMSVDPDLEWQGIHGCDGCC